MEDNRKKIKIIVTTIFSVITLLIIGFSYAWFQGQIGPAATANVLVDAKTTDVLTFNKGNDITIQPTQANFGSGAGNRTGSTTATATLLANNDTNSATETYNLYFEITGNSMQYTTQAQTPELLLTITNPNNQAVTSLTGLTYTTVNGISGFDITTKKGLIQIASNYTITSTGTKTDTWTITVTFVNLGSDQSANSTRRFSCNAIIQKSAITTAMLDTGQNVNAKMKTLANNGTTVTYSEYDNKIAAIKKADSLPSGFTATTANTISTSTIPVYIWYEEDVVEALMGDYNNDGYINTVDKSYFNGLVSGSNTPTEVDYILFDYNHDRVFNVQDKSYFNDIQRGDISPKAYIPIYLEGAYPFFSQVTPEYGTIYFYSEADIIYLSNNSNTLFYKFNVLSNISDLSFFNTSKVTSMYIMFSGCSNLRNLSGLANWNLSSVTNMNDIFSNCASITSLSSLSNWDVSSVTTMSDAFLGCSSLTNLTGLENWNVSLVKYMDSMFQICTSLTSLTALANWDVSSSIRMIMMFSGCTNISSLSGLDYWDVSNVTDMHWMFRNCSSLTNLSSLADWDVSNVTDMNLIFYNCTGLTTLTGLTKWNVSKVENALQMFYSCSSLTTLTGLENWKTVSLTNVVEMFRGCSGLTDASAINNWDVNNIIFTSNDALNNKFYYMFYDANNVHPTFSKRTGTWSNGSFIPST